MMQSSSRNKAKVRVLAVHTTEGIMRAVDLRAWTSWPGSSHAAADETGVLLAGAGDGFVDYDRAAWTLRSGNPWSENIELCGFAKWKRADWLARPKLLDACARWLAARSVARGIPLVKLSPKEYAAGRSGVIGHHDHTVGYSDGTHWDPGPDFPYDVVLAKASAYAAGQTPEDDMPLTEQDLSRIADAVWQRNIGYAVGGNDADAAMGEIFGNSRAIVAALAGLDADVDEAALAAALAPLITSKLTALSATDLANIAKAVADEQARRQAA